MAFSVRVEAADQPDVADLIGLSDDVARRLYPGAFRRPLDASSLAGPDVVVLVSRTAAGTAAGCCALFLGRDGTGELKRMIVRPLYRGRGVGRMLVEAAIAEARSRGVALLRLEVGVRNGEARALYRRMGFRDRGPFGAYTRTPISSYMERDV